MTLTSKLSISRGNSAPMTEQEDPPKTFDRWNVDPSFTIDGLSPDMPPGLYRLSIETPDADSVSEILQFQAHQDDGRRMPLKVSVVRNRGKIALCFVMPSATQSLSVMIYSDGKRMLRVTAIHIRRISTTLWRLEQGLGSIGRRVFSPKLLWSDTMNAVGSYRKDGLDDIRRRLMAVLTPGGNASDLPFDIKVNIFAHRIAVQNDAALKLLGDAQTTPASLSIVVPVFKTPKKWLLVLIDSLNNQTDPDFEVLFVLDGPQDDLAQILRDSVKRQYRSTIISLPKNLGVSGATNAGIAAASGDYVVIIDHDDALELHFVESFRLASAVSPADVYFADECITDDEMVFVRSVASRGQFDIRHYLSHPYIVHPIFVRRSLAIEAGLLDEKLRISHDVEFFLRCVAIANTIVQIPLVLYFWRTHSGSLGHVGKAEVADNTGNAVRAFIEKTTDWPYFDVRPGVNFNEIEVRPPLVRNARTAIVIPTKNKLSLVTKCLDSIYIRKPANATPVDIYVIDHDSTDPEALRYLAREQAAGRITVLQHSGEWNYSAINNAAVSTITALSSYTHLVFMNNDIELVTPDWLDVMISQFSWGDVGVVGCCLIYPDSRIQHGGVIVGMTEVADHSHRFEESRQQTNGLRAPGYLSSLVATRDYSAMTAALMIVPVELFQLVGGFDDELKIGFNDTDLCLRIGALGFHSTYVGSVVAVHHESASRKEFDGTAHPRDTETFRERYQTLIKDGDPYYGMQLDVTSTPIRLATIPSKKFFLRAMRLHQQKNISDITSVSKDNANAS